MNNCLNCKYASWTLTKSNRFHTNGSGRCTWKLPEIKLPNAFYYISNTELRVVPNPTGGAINRKDNDLEDCPCWEAK
jgi:hypothetical protein